MYLFKYSVDCFNDETNNIETTSGICFAGSMGEAANYIEHYFGVSIQSTNIEYLSDKREVPICILSPETVKTIEEDDIW